MVWRHILLLSSNVNWIVRIHIHYLVRRCTLKLLLLHLLHLMLLQHHWIWVRSHITRWCGLLGKLLWRMHGLWWAVVIVSWRCRCMIHRELLWNRGGVYSIYKVLRIHHWGWHTSCKVLRNILLWHVHWLLALIVKLLLLFNRWICHSIACNIAKGSRLCRLHHITINHYSLTTDWCLTDELSILVAIINWWRSHLLLRKHLLGDHRLCLVEHCLIRLDSHWRRLA